MTTTGYCTLCKKPSVCVCQRCGDFYCSPACQRQDWHRHRYICFPMPALVHHTVLNMSSASSSSDSQMPLITAATFANVAPDKQQKALESVLKITPQKAESHANTNSTHSESDGQQKVPKSNGKQQAPPIMESSIPQNNSHVLLTSFRSPNRCYVRLISPAELEKHAMVIKNVDNYGSSARKLKKVPPHPGYAICNLEGRWCRVEILSARSPNNVRVLFCDYGKTGVRTLADLREISFEILQMPQCVLMVQLNNVENYSMNEKLTSFLSQFENKEFRLRYTSDNERNGNVRLYHRNGDKCLNDEIVTFGKNIEVYSKDQMEKSVDDAPAKQTNNNYIKEKTSNEPMEMSKTPAVTMTAPFKTQMFQLKRKNIKTVVLDVSSLDFGYFGCIAEEDLQVLISIQLKLKECKDTNQSYKPRLNEYCIAKFEDDWYRAKVIEIPHSNQYTVVYIDFTNESTLRADDIRPYPADLKLDCRTNLCQIDGLPAELNVEQVNFLKNEINVQSKITIDQVKEIDDEVVIVECNSLLRKMRDKQLL